MFYHIILSIVVGFIAFVLSALIKVKNDPNGTKWLSIMVVVVLSSIVTANYFLNNYLSKEEQEYNILNSGFYYDGLIREIKNNNAIIGATVNDRKQLEIMVLDDGIDKSGVAVYHCRLAKELGYEIKSVKIMDINRKRLAITSCR